MSRSLGRDSWEIAGIIWSGAIMMFVSAMLVSSSASACALNDSDIVRAADGQRGALESLDVSMRDCQGSFLFFGLRSALSYGYPKSEEQRMESVRNLAGYAEDDNGGAMLSLAFAVELHAHKQCRSVPILIKRLRKFVKVDWAAEESLMLSAMRYGDFHVGREYAVKLKRKGDAKSLLEAALVIAALQSRGDAEQHRQLLQLEARGLPDVHGASEEEFRWVRDAPRNMSVTCNDAGRFH